ncbi:unnamed protein product [Urochloa humidicola]
MDAIVSLVILLLVSEAGASKHADRPTGPAVTSPRTMAPTEYWQAVLPDTPIPKAIHDLLAQSTGHASKENKGATQGHDIDANHSEGKIFARGPRKIGKGDEVEMEMHISNPQSENKKKDLIVKGMNNHITLFGPKIKDDSWKVITSHASQNQLDARKSTITYMSQGEESPRKTAQSYEFQGGKDIRKISTSYGSEGDKNFRTVSTSYGSHGDEKLRKISTSYGSQAEDLSKISTSYGSQGEDLRTVSTSYGSKGEGFRTVSTSYGSQGEDFRTVSTSYGSKGDEDLSKISTSYGSQGENFRTVSTSYGSKGDEDLSKIRTSYGSQGEGFRTVSTSYGSQGEDFRTVSTSYGSKGDEDLSKISTSYGSQGEGFRAVSTSYGSQGDKNFRTVSTSYGSQAEDLSKISTSYGSQGQDLRTVSTSYGSKGDEDLSKISTSYGSQGGDFRTVSTSYGSHGEEDLRKISTSHGSQGHGHHHVHSHNDGNKVADVFFFHDVLRPGSMITPIIPLTTSLPTLLLRREADSLPFSTKRLDDILAMFAPASLAMADEIRRTLDTCEHPHPLPGEKAGCATSLESLAKLPAALLGTRNVRAFSGEMPIDPAGTTVRRGRYNVTAVRNLSESPVAAVCHDLTYPYAVFYCHTTNPTAAYLVTLVAEDGASPAMEALAVCHLDTSQWSPRQPFLVAHNIRPGDVAVCHFLSKLSIVWIPADEQAGGAREAL